MSAPQTIPANTLGVLAALVEARSGLRFVGGRYDELASKVERAFAESECSTWPEYQAQVTSGALFEQLIEMLTVGETYFYRHRPYFDMLEREVLPEIVARRRDSKRLRVWCAGCATGEEPYSLAIALRAVLPDVDDWQVTVLATDLNRSFLARAEAGIYGEWSFRETDPAFKTANFLQLPDARRFQVRPELRKLVRFAQLNLAEDGYPSAAGGTANLDLILCRNVLLYFSQELTQQVVGRLRASLVPGGWLVLGPSDTRPGLLADFQMHAADGAVVYRRVDRDDPPALTLREPVPLKVADQHPFGEGWPTLSTSTGSSDESTLRKTSANGIPQGAWATPLRPEGPPGSERSEADSTVSSALRKTSAGSSDESTLQKTAAKRIARQTWGNPPGPEGPPTSERSEADSRVSAEGDWHAAWVLARTSADSGELDLAEEHCQQAIARAHLRPEPYYLFGALRLARGDDAGSLEAYRKALYVDPRFVPALFAQAAIHRRGGAPARARQALIRAHRLLEGRVANEWVLVDDGLTVGRLRDAVVLALGDEGLGAA